MRVKAFCFLSVYLFATSAFGFAASKEGGSGHNKSRPQSKAAPHIIPDKHPLKKTLDKIFSKSKVLKNEKNFKAAGFKTVFLRRKNSIRIVRHPKVKGYLFKLFLDKDSKGKRDQNQKNLIRRCTIAAKVRRLVDKHHMDNFTVPKKWLYEIPNQKRRTFVLLAQDMNLVSRAKSEEGWKKKITKKHLKELHVILRHGYGSLAVSENVPYTKDKNFSFIDTEYPKRDFPLHRLEHSLSNKMSKYWREIIKK